MNKRARPALFLGMVALVLVAVALMATVIPFRQIVDQQNRLERARTQLTAVVAENDLLDREVAALATPGEIERLAREKLGYVMPGETAYVILDPPDSEGSTEGFVSDDPKPLPWYRAIWNFFTGADLASNPSQG